MASVTNNAMAFYKVKVFSGGYLLSLLAISGCGGCGCHVRRLIVVVGGWCLEVVGGNYIIRSLKAVQWVFLYYCISYPIFGT